ncbi:MAG TPA: tetratricopeptide repeat protein [Allosphingosinicella sp.]
MKAFLRAAMIGLTLIPQGAITGQAADSPSLVADPVPPSDPAAAAAPANLALIASNVDYASRSVASLERALRSASPDPAREFWVDMVRAAALVAEGNRGDAADLILLALGSRRPDSARQYASAWEVASALRDPVTLIEVVEAAARNVPPPGRSSLFTSFDMDRMANLSNYLRSDERAEWRERLAAALVTLGWPGPEDPETADYFRMVLIDRALARRERSRAAEIARTLATPDSLVSMMVVRRYDGLARNDGPAALENAIANLDRVSAAAATAHPDDHMAILVRAQFLRRLGRYEEALVLLRPYLTDVAATAAPHSQGIWLVNDAAYVLLSLGRNDEAVALMRQLVALNLETYPDLIGPRINFAEILGRSGHPGEVLDYVASMEVQLSRGANEYGRMEAASAATCALSDLGRAGEATAWIERMRAQEGENWKALLHAYFCLNDLDSAETLLLRKLGGADPEGAIVMLQDYGPDGPGVPVNPLHSRFDTVRARPAVAAALARVGRVIRLPYPRSEAPGP